MLKPANESRHIFSVTKLNRLVKTILEGEVGVVWLSAEISNFTAAASGHWYFTLKDARSQIRSAMFRGANMRIRYRPKEGDKVLVRGNLSLYEPRGDYQLIVEHMELDGAGALQAEFEALKRKLNQLGLFATDRKRPLPHSIQTVGIVTSSTGAALHDVLTVLKRRSPMTRVVIYPSQVQGETASEQVQDAIRIANKRKEVDVLIVGRGGGSIEDLWCFNSEALAHCIAESDIPIISAVGHEVDVTIADFVADLRAPTPSAAAELVSQDNQALAQQLAIKLRSLKLAMDRTVDQRRYRLSIALQGMERNHPSSRLRTQVQRLDELTNRLQYASKTILKNTVQRHDNISLRLAQCHPGKHIERKQHLVEQLRAQLARTMTQRLTSNKQRFAHSLELMHSLSPLATLSRGYSATFLNDKVVSSSDDVKPGDTILTKLKQGEFTSQVLATKNNTE